MPSLKSVEKFYGEFVGAAQARFIASRLRNAMMQYTYRSRTCMSYVYAHGYISTIAIKLAILYVIPSYKSYEDHICSKWAVNNTSNSGYTTYRKVIDKGSSS